MDRTQEPPADPAPGLHPPAAPGDPDETAAVDEPEEQDWAAYYRYTLGREPRPLFVRGMAAVEAAASVPGQAVEIGFGDGTETMCLLEAGWSVTAVDGAPAAAEVLLPRVPYDVRDRLHIEIGPADDVDLPPFDLLYSSYVLSYLEPVAFARLWGQVRTRLRPGGFVVVNVFGDHDEGAGEPGTTHLPRAEVEALFDGLEVVTFEEIDEDGGSFVGPKHWHVFDVIARRPVGGVPA